MSGNEGVDRASRASGAPVGGRFALVTLGLVCLLVIISQFYRSANAVIGPQLMDELGLSAAGLGILTASFFLAFTIFQVPAGLLLDRFGPRMTMAGTLLIAVVGACLFAIGQGLISLSIARALLGIGCSCLLMGSLILCSRWFSRSKLGLMTGIVLSTGNLGALLATAPLALSTALIGWRGSFLVLAVLTAVLAAVVVWILRDWPAGHAPRPDTSSAGSDGRPAGLMALLRGIPTLLQDPSVRRAFVMGFVSYAGVVTVLGLWGGPYLRHVHALETVAIGNILLIMAVAHVLGPVLFGLAERLVPSRRRLVIWGAAATVICLGILALLPGLPLWAIAVLFAAFGLVGSYNSALLAQSRTLFDDASAGRGMTLINLGIMAGVTTFQLSTGGILQLFVDDTGAVAEEGYRTVFGVMALVVATAILYYRSVREGGRPPG